MLDSFASVSTFRECNGIVMTSLIACNCIVFESFFSYAIMADKQTFKAGLFYKHCTRIAIGRYLMV